MHSLCFWLLRVQRYKHVESEAKHGQRLVLTLKAVEDSASTWNMDFAGLVTTMALDLFAFVTS